MTNVFDRIACCRTGLLVLAVGLLLILSGCSGAPDSEAEPEPTGPVYHDHAELLSILEKHCGASTECPAYISDTRSGPDDQQICYTSAVNADLLMEKVLEDLTPKDRSGDNADLDWTIRPQIAGDDDCEFSVIANNIPLMYEQGDALEGRALFLFVDRAACDDGTVLVVLSNG
ncbi:MAG: hypothetical protein GY716_00990 [bacterium]|nr:hypothetical protein [bacterium]